ncbi:MAG: dTDP-4-dehydrorhamnose 3,5-epimerase [Mariprofundaceae bacterium]|nr:dTDP-4-dehydrorhamnose 3,5-epimerase [Mariprofundaceae bacterium]
MQIITTKLKDVLLIKPTIFGDTRGFFLETWNKKTYMEAGFPDIDFVQDNHSRSGQNILRGLHFQRQHPQGKLVRVTQGSVFDVAVDIRPQSPTFGQWVGYELSEENAWQLYIPPGFAHGFCVLSESADFLYKCTDYYHPEDEGGILWSDPNINIDWPIKEPFLSQKDCHYAQLKGMKTEQLPKIKT